MRLFFLIACHKITPSLVYNLKKFATFKNSKILDNFTGDDLVQSENIMKDQIDVKWGSVTQVIKNENFDYVSLLSGEDVFIKTIYFIYNKEFIGVQKNNGQY